MAAVVVAVVTSWNNVPRLEDELWVTKRATARLHEKRGYTTNFADLTTSHSKTLSTDFSKFRVLFVC